MSSEQPKEYIISIAIKVPASINETHVERYIRDQIFTHEWAEGFRTNYIHIDQFTFSRTHPTPAQGTSKLCFGTQHPASECCQQCNELETCKQKQRYLDYDKKEVARNSREDFAKELLQYINPDSEAGKVITSRSTQQQAGSSGL